MEYLALLCHIEVWALGYRWSNGRLEEIREIKWRDESVHHGVRFSARYHEDLDERHRTFYDPFTDVPALFALFAEMEATKANIIDFANRYGPICRTLQDWRSAQSRMQGAIAQWQEFLNPAPDQEKRAHEKWDELIEVQTGVAALAPITWRDKERAILDALTKTLAYGCVRINLDMGELIMRIDDPLQAVKMQLGRAIAAKKILRHCQWCNTPFLVDPPATRSTRLYCKRSCAVMASRARKGNNDKEA